MRFMVRFCAGFVAAICCLGTFEGSVRVAPVEAAPENQVTVMFRPGIVQFPPGEYSASATGEVITSEGVLQVLTAWGPSTVELAFPAFQPSDTIGIARTGEQVRLNDYSRIFKIILPVGVSTTAVAESLSLLPDVAFAEPDGTAETDASTYPNDPRFTNGTQWGNWNYGQSGGTPNADVNAPEAWGVTTGVGSPLIAIVDRGVDLEHEDLTGRVYGDGPLPGEQEPEHGSRVAGIIGATTNNSIGIAGMIWNATILSRLLRSSDTDVTGAVRSAASNGAAVINNSWHLSGPDGRFSTQVRLAFADAYKLNCVAVVSMGNTAPSAIPNHPAASGQGIIAVGATDRQDQRASFSAFGNHIDLVAPGVAITSTVPGNGYSSANGISFSVPYVSGIAGLLLAYRPELYNDDVEQIFLRSCDDLGADDYDIEYGAGRVNARKALDLIRPPNSLTHSTFPAGGTIESVTDWIPMSFYGAGLVDGQSYSAKRYEIHQQVTFLDPPPASVQVAAWGRGVATVGYSAENPNWGLGWCDPVTVSHGGYTMKTYVYQVQIPPLQGGGYRWVPTDPDHVVCASSVLKFYSPPDTAQSYYVPQRGSVGTPVEGTSALTYFRVCPNNDTFPAGTLAQNTRIKVVVKNALGAGIPGIQAADIFIPLNGGTLAQGFIGDGADSVIANSTYSSGQCPNLRSIEADAPTDAQGVTYITLAGKTPGSPGVGTRDPARKWGHYDTDLPIYVLGQRLSGRLTSGAANGSYVLRIRNVDLAGGLGTAQTDKGQIVTIVDSNAMATGTWWGDFDNDGTTGDYDDAGVFAAHYSHACENPNNP